MWAIAKSIWSIVDVLLTVFAIGYSVVASIGAASNGRWEEATFWIAFLILIKIHKDNK